LSYPPLYPKDTTGVQDRSRHHLRLHRYNSPIRRKPDDSESKSIRQDTGLGRYTKGSFRAKSSAQELMCLPHRQLCSSRQLFGALNH